MGIERKSLRSAFEERLLKSASVLPWSGPHLLVLVPRSGSINHESIAGSVTLSLFCSQEEIDDLEIEDETIGPFDGDENLHLSPQGARDLAEKLLRAADAAESFLKNPAIKPETVFIVCCDECEEVLGTPEKVSRLPTRSAAVAAAAAVGWKCGKNDDEETLCSECLGSSLQQPDESSE